MFAQVGTTYIAMGVLAGIVTATASRADVPTRSHLRVPRTMELSTVLLACAAVGFAADEVWHRAFGRDSAMWTPTHLLMLLGGTALVLTAKLVLDEGGFVARRDLRTVLVGGAFGTLLVGGFSMLQGEYNMGGPFFPQAYHPVLVLVSGAFAFTLVARAFAPGAATVAAVLLLALNVGPLLPDFGLPRTREALYVGTAVAIDVLVSRRQFGSVAVRATLAALLVGLPTEVLWSQGWRQPWSSDMLLHAAPFVVIGVAAAVTLAEVFARGSASPRQFSTRWVVAAAALVAVLVIPAPVNGADVALEVRVLPVDDTLQVDVQPPDAPVGAWWFQVVGYGGGGVFAHNLRPVAGHAGRFATTEPVELGPRWKVAVRLHEGSTMVLLPLDNPQLRKGQTIAGRMLSERDPAVRTRIGLGATGPLTLGFAALAAVLSWWMVTIGRLLGVTRPSRRQRTPWYPITPAIAPYQVLRSQEVE